MNRLILTFGGLLSASSLLLMDSAIKGTVLLALAAVVALMLRRDSAATRHLVWMMAIIALLIVPVLSVTLPQWRVLPNWMSSPRPSVAATEIDSPIPIAKSNGDVIEMPHRASPVAPMEVDPLAAPDLQPAVPSQVLQPTMMAPSEIPEQFVGNWSWMNAIPLVWAIGFTVLMLRLSAARWMLWNSERLAVVIGRQEATQRASAKQSHSATSRDPIVIAMTALRSQLKIRRPITLLIHPHKTIPVVWGIFRCRLMLPVAARQWSEEQLQSVLMHELAHIKRGDILVQLLTQVACALHWFNPLVWFAAWRLDVERERSCDDLVLASGIRPSAYAAHLLDVVSGLSPARWTQACGLAMARKSSIESRLTAVLGKDLNRRNVSLTLAGLALFIAVGIAVPIAMLRAADEEWNPPQVAHVSNNDFSTYCVHDAKEAAYVIAYHGRTGSSTSGSNNSESRTWNDNATLTLLDTAEKRKFTLGRDHTAPNKLTLDGKEYDLAKGRVFLLDANGSIRQLDIATPPVTAREGADRLAKLIATTTPCPMKNRTGKLQPQTVAKLKWGEPVNGLRMALAFPPALNDPLLGDEDFYQLVVQNVSEKGVRYTASDNAPNPRSMIYREGKRIVQVLSDKDAQRADWNLAPGECGVLWLFTKEERNQDGKTVSSLLDNDLPSDTSYHVVVSMEITQAPEGAWTGKLVTGELRGSEEVAAPPTPIHKDARALYEVWQRYTRSNGDIPGGLVGELAKAIKVFIGYNPTWETVPKLNAILPRLDATHDWKLADAIALLDEVAGVQATLLEPAPWKGTRQGIRQGEALPKKYADVSWGEEQPSGLRAAWLLEPNAAEHRIGAALKARLLVHNRGQVPVMLQVPTWHQGQVKGTDANGAEVQVSGIEWTTMALLNTARLGPGEYIEINTPGVGIGPRAGMGPWAGPRVGSNVLAKPGDELTLTYSLVPLDGSEVGVSEDDPHVAGPSWWLAHIKTRLNRELPLPSDAAERTRILDRAVRELFATAPTAEETETFIADKSPEAIDALAKRLNARADAVSFSGKLPTAPVKFRVLDAAADVDKQPRVVLGPGEYPLPSTTGDRGQATLKIVGRPVGDRRTNDAQILFEATEATGKLPPDPHKLDVPDGWRTWAIVCRPSDGYFYLLHKGTVRKIDYSKPGSITDTPANDMPVEFRDEVKRQLDIHEISAEQQAEIFGKPAAPAVSLRVDVQESSQIAATMPQPKTTEQEGVADTTTQPDWVLAWDFRITPLDQQYSKMRISREGNLEMILREPPLLRTQLSADELSELTALVAKNPQAKSQPMSKLAKYSKAISPTLELFEALKKVQVRSEIVAVVHEGKLFELDLNTAEAMAVDVQLKKFVGLAAIGGSEELSRLVELANRELMRKYPDLSTQIDPTDFSYGEVDHPSGKISVWFNYSINPDSSDGQMVLLRISENGQPSIEKVILPRIVNLDETDGTEWKLTNADATIIKVPDDQYVKSGLPVDELAGEGVIWNDVQNGLSLGYRITGDEWRILGKEVKVELWVQNHGDKDVKFQDNMRRDPEFGLRVKLKDAKGEVHDSNFWPDDRPPFGFHRLLPPGHALKIKEFTVSLLWPSNDFSNVKGHFFGIAPGAYNLHCELELPGFSATGEGGKQLTPAVGEWTGKLTTRGLNIEIIAPDAPATKPRIESVNQSDVSSDLERAAESIRRLARLSPVPSNKELEAAINLLVTSTDNNLANQLVLQLGNHRISETTETIDPIRLTGFTILMTREMTSTLAFLRSVRSTVPEKEQQRIDQLIGAVERSALNKVAPQSASKPKVTPKERRQVATFFEEPVYQDQLEGYSTHADRLLELVTRRLTADYRAREKLTLKEEWIEALAKVVWQKIQEKPQDELNAKLSEEQRFGMSHAWGLASMQDWLLTKSLYERYGGRVGFGSLGLWLAPDGRNALIKEAIEAGNFKILDPELEKAFWDNANKKNFADAYPTGEDLKRYLSYPPQLGN